MTTDREVTLEEAYSVACQALGESIVQQRLMGKRIQELEHPESV